MQADPLHKSYSVHSYNYGNVHLKFVQPYRQACMIVQATVGLIAISPIFLMATTSADISASKQSCNPIGRITHGSSENFRRGRVICEGWEIREPREVQFLCFTNNALVPLTGQSVVINEETCQQTPAVSNSGVRPCSRQGISRFLCLFPKGPDEQFALIEPDAVSANPRPSISWEEVENTESYTVQVIGPDISWERTVEAAITEMAYPTDEPSLREGNAYEVIAIANRAEESIATSKVVNIEVGSEIISLKSK